MCGNLPPTIPYLLTQPPPTTTIPNPQNNKKQQGGAAFPAEAPQPGDRTPDGPLVRMTSGGSTGLLEATCRGLRHTLLLFGGGAEGRRVTDLLVDGGGEKEEAAALVQLQRFADVLAVVHVSRQYYLPSSSSSTPPPAAAVAKDSKSKDPAAAAVLLPPMEALYDDGAVARAFGLADAKQQSPGGVMECLFLVRPDGYVAVRAAGWGLRPVVEYLGTLFPERVVVG